MTDKELSILKNTIGQMAADADDKGQTDFSLRLSVADAFNLCKLEPPHRWIPCSERLPETDGPYLVAYDKNGWIGAYNFAQEQDFPGLTGKKNVWWRMGDNQRPLMCCSVTHWMPLPEPPEEGGKENAAD